MEQSSQPLRTRGRDRRAPEVTKSTMTTTAYTCQELGETEDVNSERARNGWITRKRERQERALRTQRLVPGRI